jgi:aspartate aminotransferase
MIYSKRALEIESSVTLAISAKASKMKKEGLDVISLSAGEPDFNTPLNIQNGAINSMREGYTKYTPASGIIELKQEICNKFKKDNDLNYNPSQIIVCTGAKQCLANVFQAIINPGDEIIIPSPYWVSYPELIKLFGGVPVFMELNVSDSFRFTKELLKKHLSPKTKAIVINSPNNPTGAVYSKEELTVIAEFAREHDIFIISDEIYEKLIYGEHEHISIASLSQDAYERTLVINGVSKSYAMTGWRIGYAAGNETLINIMSNIQSHTTSNPTSIAQYASLEALEGDQSTVEIMASEFKKRKNYMVSRINSISSISCINPEGAFYVMINISKAKNGTINGKIIETSVDFSNYLLDEEKVAVVPGVAFGTDDYVRLSYATSLENIVKGLDRIENFLGKINFNK